MLHEEVELYSRLTGKDGYKTPICVIGAYLDGYEKGKADTGRTGKWIMTWNKWFKADFPVCSSCSVGSPYKTKFCPNCGARMEKEVTE